MSDLASFSNSLSGGLSVISPLLDAVGFSLCLVYRRLSRKMILPMAGFAGLFASGVIFASAAHVFSGLMESIYLAILGAEVLAIGSKLLVVLGLAAVFADLRVRVALAMEPPHARH